MDIGIISAGDIGRAFAIQAVKAGYEVIVLRDVRRNRECRGVSGIGRFGVIVGTSS